MTHMVSVCQLAACCQQQYLKVSARQHRLAAICSHLLLLLLVIRIVVWLLIYPWLNIFPAWVHIPQVVPLVGHLQGVLCPALVGAVWITPTRHGGICFATVLACC